MIHRDFYLEKIKRKMWDGNIKVITGIRRCGKSTLLFGLFKEYLLSIGVDQKHILEYQLDQIEQFKYRDPRVLYDEVKDITNAAEDEKFYLFIDEVQLTKSIVENDIEINIYDMLNGIRNKRNLDCYVTGSNSKMLSTDIATEFRGRSSQIRVYPLSFQEFYSSKGGEITKALQEYMIYGGMPGLLILESEEEKKDYLKNLFDEIYIKDLVAHGRMKREDILVELLDAVSSQIGSLTNATRLTAIINARGGTKIDEGMVERYLKQMIDAFLISEVKRFDIKGNKYFDFPNKYYYVDLGLRNSRLNFRQIDPGHIVENMIYNELIRRGYSVDVGVVEEREKEVRKQKEIDFVVNLFDKRVYIQSALRMDEEKKEKSELSSFALTGDFFKKIVIRNDIPGSFYDASGIYHVALEDFMLDAIELF